MPQLEPLWCTQALELPSTNRVQPLPPIFQALLLKESPLSLLRPTYIRVCFQRVVLKTLPSPRSAEQFHTSHSRPSKTT